MFGCQRNQTMGSGTHMFSVAVMNLASDSRLFGDIIKARHAVFGLERAGGNQILRRDFVGVLAERHVRDVQQPARVHVRRIVPQRLEQLHGRVARTFRASVDARAPDWEEARLGPMVEQAVLLFAEAEIGGDEQPA